MSEDRESEPKAFSVRDRRTFTQEGELREPAAQPQATPSPQPAAAPPTAVSDDPPAPVADHEAESAPLPTDLPSLWITLATQGSFHLMGAGREDGTPDLEGARAVITLLEVLEQKTRGNLTADEAKLIESLLFDLRTAFVARARASGTR